MAELGNLGALLQQAEDGLGEEKAVEITVDMLDFDYVSKCTDRKKLKGILERLQSGTDGLYPELEQRTEAKLLELLPEKEKQKILRLKHKTTQKEISEAEDLLKDWQSTVNKKDIELQKATKVGDSGDSSSIFTSATLNKNLPPVRGSATLDPSNSNSKNTKKVVFESQSKQDSPSSKEEKPSGRLSGYDFRAWEKYDAEKEAEKINEFEQPFFDLKPGKSLEELQNEVGAKRAAAHNREMEQIQSELGAGGLSTLQRTTRANREKIKGNECFKIGEMEEAFSCYSRSLALDATNAITYANRAMTSLRLNKLELAEDDCSRSISIDPHYVKAWSRRGSTRFKRGKYKEAVRDFEEALKLTSADSPGHEELLNLARTAREKYMEVEGKHLPSSDGNITPYICDSLDAFAKKAIPPSNAECVRSGKCTVVHFVEESEEPKGTRITISVESDSDESDSEEPQTSDGNGVDNSSGFRRIAIVEESDSEDEEEANEAKAIELKDEANELVKAGKSADAETLYTEALDLCQEGSSTALAVLNNRSRVRISLGNFSAAARDAAEVLKHEPRNLKALYRRAMSNHKLGGHEESLVDLKEVLSIDSGNKQAAELLEAVTAALTAAACIQVEESVKIRTSLKDQGNAAMVAKRYDEALGLYSKAISQEGDGTSEARAILLSNRSQAYLKMNKYTEAESDANDAIEILKKGSTESAAALCKKAIFRRALAYQGMGGMMHLNASIADLESLVAEDPDNKSFKKELIASQTLLKEKGGKVASPSPKIDGPITTMPPVPPQDLGMKESKTTKRSTPTSGATAVSALPEAPTTETASTKPSAAISSVAKERSPQPKVVSTKRPSVPTDAPKTVYELEKVWRALKSYPDLLAEYLAVFKKGTYKKVFKETVSPDLLSSVFSALRDHASPEVVATTLLGLSNIPSFSMVSALLPAEDLATAREALDKVEDLAKREELKKKYS